MKKFLTRTILALFTIIALPVNLLGLVILIGLLAYTIFAAEDEEDVEFFRNLWAEMYDYLVIAKDVWFGTFKAGNIDILNDYF